MEHVITMKEIQNRINQGVATFMRKDNSPRGCSCVSANEIKPGDEILIDNYFTTVSDTLDPDNGRLLQQNHGLQDLVNNQLELIHNLASENEVLQNDNENLIADLQDYETENAKLIAENETLQNKITNLENENDELRTQLHQYKALFADIEQSMAVSLYESLLGKAAN